MKRIVNLELWMESSQFEDHASDKNNSQISTLPRECKNEVRMMKQNLTALQKSISTEKETMNEMKGVRSFPQHNFPNTISPTAISPAANFPNTNFPSH